MMSICTDAQGRVAGVCPDNLTGGDGWVWIETNLTPADNLTDEHGTALYKMVGGAVVARTQAEVDADAPKSEPTAPTVEERLAAVESATLDLMLGGVL